jgi:hypothetical protein
MSAGDSRRVGFALSASTSVALLIGMVAYGVFLIAGPPVSTWNVPPRLAIPLIAAYAALTAVAWHLALKRSPAGRSGAVLLVGAAAGATTLVVFVIFNVLVIVLSLVLQLTGS